MPEAIGGRDRELVLVVQARIVEGARRAVHLEVGHERVPVGHRAPVARPRVRVDTCQPEGIRNQGGRVAPARAERLAVHEQLGIESARPPAHQNLLYGRYVDLPAGGQAFVQQVDHWLQVGRESDDGADVEVLVGPAVETMADARGERVVDGRVAQRAGDADRLQAFAGVVRVVEDAFDADDGAELQQRQSRGRVIEVDLAGLDGFHDVAWQRVGGDLESHAERGL